MKSIFRLRGCVPGISGLLAFLLLWLGCAPQDPAGYFFAGRVYDAVTGARVIGYTLELEYIDHIYRGTVGESGRFLVGSLEPHHDYSITVKAEGYRAFLSHNEALGELEGFRASLYYDIYLFPVGLKSPKSTVEVFVSDSEQRPGGYVRLQPSIPSSLYDSAQETPAGVGAQVWSNDEDLQHDTVVQPLINGVANFAEGALVYGVSYAVTVYGVSGYQDLEGVDFVAGRDQMRSFVLSPLTQPTLELVFSSTDLGLPAVDGHATFVFNRPVELDPHQPDAYYLEFLDDNFSIYSPDVDQDNQVNLLADDVNDTVSERGTSLSVVQNALSLNWDMSAAFSAIDADDTILSVTYGGLDLILIRPVGGMESEGVALSDLVGLSVTVDLHP